MSSPGGGEPARPALRVSVSAIVNPSEMLDRVRAAVLRIFPSAAMRVDAHPADRLIIRAEAASLDRFAETIAQARIRDAARAVMIRGMPRGDERRTRFFLNKQAALGGRVNFADEAAILGPIVVEVEGEGLMDKIDEMTLHD
jgi:predicted RNA binding protein with dsRBD fold (UPF0201 family)